MYFFIEKIEKVLDFFHTYKNEMRKEMAKCNNEMMMKKFFNLIRKHSSLSISRIYPFSSYSMQCNFL